MTLLSLYERIHDFNETVLSSSTARRLSINLSRIILY